MNHIMANWWKIMALQIVITVVTHSTGLELQDDSKLSQENIISLFNKYIESTIQQRNTEEINDEIEQIEDFFQPFAFGKPPRNEITNANSIPKESIDAKNKNKKKDKYSGVRLCYFKLCEEY